jgi:hypothetical protein
VGSRIGPESGSGIRGEAQLRELRGNAMTPRNENGRAEAAAINVASMKAAERRAAGNRRQCWRRRNEALTQ